MSLESGGTTGQSKEADSGDAGVNLKETESKILELKKTEKSEKRLRLQKSDTTWRNYVL